MTSTPFLVFDLGDFKLQKGGTLRAAKLAYTTHGTLNTARDNAIVAPVWFAGTHDMNTWLIGPGEPLDPERYFVIVPNLFGNGLSSSPSNTPAPFDGPRFPAVTMVDNVRAQHELVTRHLGVKHIELVTGSSMGAMQAFHWAALYPDLVRRIAPFCGAARCSRHNQVFLEGVRAALTADAAFARGAYTTRPERGLRAMGRVYAGWALSQAFYREGLDLTALGYSSLEDFIIGFWESAFLDVDANDLLAMLWTWQHGDIGDNEHYRGDFKRALQEIRARAFVMPSQTDLYFPPEDSEIEVAHMRNAQLHVIPSIWGHMAGGPALNPVDAAFIKQKLMELLRD
ncbi:alpha/beta fold hydrolase [Trinickia acidisoli]|uniref:alpha/beta fold hydrolase n=1 Tax=Trinickia acidisoli TaxID=2767482 RepID=UPI001A8ECE6F|nr:alpha/beta fold hydrolase [Trinickia acidisoli]